MKNKSCLNNKMKNRKILIQKKKEEELTYPWGDMC